LAQGLFILSFIDTLPFPPLLNLSWNNLPSARFFVNSGVLICKDFICNNFIINPLSLKVGVAVATQIQIK
jgi:hypothetical protein